MKYVIYTEMDMTGENQKKGMEIEEERRKKGEMCARANSLREDPLWLD